MDHPGACICDCVERQMADTINVPEVSFEEATHRTTRWIDRCIAAHARKHDQNLFGIVQGGLDPELRRISLTVSVSC